MGVAPIFLLLLYLISSFMFTSYSVFHVKASASSLNLFDTDVKNECLDGEVSGYYSLL